VDIYVPVSFWLACHKYHLLWESQLKEISNVSCQAQGFQGNFPGHTPVSVATQIRCLLKQKLTAKVSPS
jgi:hypothetical protein